MGNASPKSADNRTLNLALLGHGKMGRAIEELALDRGWNVRLILTAESNRDGAGITKKNFDGMDVALDFTAPAPAVENIRRVTALGCPMVVGTTGWHDKLDEVRRIVDSNGVGVVYAANFSIGVQLFYRIARAAADAFA